MKTNIYDLYSLVSNGSEGTLRATKLDNSNKCGAVYYSKSKNPLYKRSSDKNMTKKKIIYLVYLDFFRTFAEIIKQQKFING